MLKFKYLLLLIFYCCLSLPMAQANSLIDPDHYRALSSDKRAYRIGEPIVIRVVESTSAESSAGTGAQRDVSIGAKIAANEYDRDISLGIRGRGDGAGQTSRKGKAFTQLSTRIVEVLPNQQFRIEGEQRLIVNGENQRVAISGLIRAEDISKDNTLLSNRIADAKIEIIGAGVIDDAQRQNIFFRVLTWLGLL